MGMAGWQIWIAISIRGSVRREGVAEEEDREVSSTALVRRPAYEHDEDD